ncbi:MAG: alpha-galactosidase [Clostridia bacterium]|nr:alpha-galactosidase [Clostridia bacterium]
MYRLKTALCLLQALLLLISTVFVMNSSMKIQIDRAAIGLTASTDVAFSPLPAQALAVTDAEREACRAWYDAHVATAQGDFAYDLTVGGRRLQTNPADWAVTVGAESAAGAVRPGGKTTQIALRHLKSGLVATVEATIYEAYAACEWTVYIKNTGDKRSPVIRDFYAADCELPLGRSDVYFSKGSAPAADDFELLRSAVCPTPMVFNANGGRSESFLPYWNLCGAQGGAVLSLGWTGQWYAALRQTASGVRVRAKQESFKAPLLPGEQVRAPLVTLTFYENENPIKGFNAFRAWETDCVCPQNQTPAMGYVIANEFNTKTCDALIAEVNAIPDDVMADIDYFWMDAGWYTYTEGWYDGVGNWTPDPARFPQGLSPLSAAMRARGADFLLWYEPERVREGTILCETGRAHPGWIVQRDDNLLWNLAEDAACDHLIAYISASLRENGVTRYRQDFNFSPLAYWRQADKALYDGRTGICENHYVTNLYRYLDALLAAVPGLMIDNCASGGKRLDIEMTRRAVPLWRSDYNCGNADGTVKPDVLEATQSMTCGLSFWLPCSGTNRYFHSVYASRTAILTHPSVYEPDPAEFAKYKEIQTMMAQRYFPLTCGGPRQDNVLAMQFGDETRGAALIYRRPEAPDTAYQLRCSGLAPDAVYRLTDLDDPAFSAELTGSALMETGVQLRLQAAPSAAIILYEAVTA